MREKRERGREKGVRVGLLLSAALLAAGTLAAQTPIPAHVGASISGPAVTVHPAVDPSQVPDSIPALKKCGPPLEPVGAVEASGVVQFTVLKSGKVDTASIQPVVDSGISDAGLRSIAVRMLGACSYRAARRDGKKVPATLQQRFNLETGMKASNYQPPFTVESRGDSIARMAQGAGSRVSASDSLTPDGRRVVRVEEAPMLVSCTVARRADPSYTTAGYVIGTDGKPEMATLETSPQASGERLKAITAMIASCTYVPARFHGARVRVKVSQGIQFR